MEYLDPYTDLVFFMKYYFKYSYYWSETYNHKDVHEDELFERFNFYYYPVLDDDYHAIYSSTTDRHKYFSKVGVQGKFIKDAKDYFVGDYLHRMIAPQKSIFETTDELKNPETSFSNFFSDNFVKEEVFDTTELARFPKRRFTKNSNVSLENTQHKMYFSKIEPSSDAEFIEQGIIEEKQEIRRKRKLKRKERKDQRKLIRELNFQKRQKFLRKQEKELKEKELKEKELKEKELKEKELKEQELKE
jgi:hypothetical protein